MEYEKLTSIDSASVPKTEMERLLEDNDLYAELQEPFDHYYLMIIRTADGKQVWSRNRTDAQKLHDDMMQFLRTYKKD